HVFTNVLPGWAPYASAAAVSAQSPAYLRTNELNRRLGGLQNVDVIITSDKSKWTRVPVLQGNASGGFKFTKENSNVKSVDKEGNPTNELSLYPKANPANRKESVGMGWFPGYAIDLDKGVRLNMMFSEFSE